MKVQKSQHCMYTINGTLIKSTDMDNLISLYSWIYTCRDATEQLVYSFKYSMYNVYLFKFSATDLYIYLVIGNILK